MGGDPEWDQLTPGMQWDPADMGGDPAMGPADMGGDPAMGPADGAPDPLFGDAGPAGGDPATGPDMPPGDPMGEPGPMDGGPGHLVICRTTNG